MKFQYAFVALAASGALAASVEAAPFASEVVSYEPGSIRSDYQLGASSLGKTASTTPGFGGPGFVVTTFNAPFSSNELTGIGPGGSLVLKLGQTAATGAGYTLGVHAGVNLGASGSGAGVTATGSTFSVRRSDLSVSYDNVTWVPLQSNVVFNVPTNWYQSGVTTPQGQSSVAADAVEANWADPFTGTLGDFSGKNWAQILTLLHGSGGGQWFDLTNVGLPGVNYVRFDVGPDDTQMYVDMVVAVPEPCGVALLAGAAGATLLRRRPRRVV